MAEVLAEQVEIVTEDAAEEVVVVEEPESVEEVTTLTFGYDE